MKRFLISGPLGISGHVSIALDLCIGGALGSMWFLDFLVNGSLLEAWQICYGDYNVRSWFGYGLD